ncbi:MAG: C2 domain-containing protein [Acidimicrobiia bacterium]
MIDPETAPELVGGVVKREIRITIPSGGLENAEVAGLSIYTVTGSPEPFSDVALQVGEPISETVTIRNAGNPKWEWAFPLPEHCEEGCEIVIPVMIEQIEEGPASKFSWSADLYFDYGSDTAVPDAARDLRAEIVPVQE